MGTAKEVIELWQAFKKLHPNNSEDFNPTFENIARWRYHVSEISGIVQPSADEQWKAMEAAREYLFGKAVKCFDELPKYMQDKYLELQFLFPDRQLYAVGSRVNGDYVELWSTDEIRRLRAEAGKRDKKESDYDFTVGPEHRQCISEMRKKTPIWADLVLNGIPDNEKILIPMWSFENLPAYEHDRVIELFNQSNWGELMVIHNQYLLSSHPYCCDEKPIREWFSWAIKEGKIKSSDEGTGTTIVDK